MQQLNNLEESLSNWQNVSFLTYNKLPNMDEIENEIEEMNFENVFEGNDKLQNLINSKLIKEHQNSFILNFKEFYEFQQNLKEVIRSLSNAENLMEDSLNEPKLELIKNVLKFLCFTNVTVLLKERKLKFNFGSRISVIKNEKILKSMLNSGRLIFYNKIKDRKIIEKIKQQYPNKLKNGGLLVGLNKEYGQYDFLEAPYELSFFIPNINEMVENVSYLYAINQSLISDKNPYKKNFEKMQDDFSEFYDQFYLYATFNEIVNLGQTIGGKLQLMKQKRERGIVDSELKNNVCLEWNKNLCRVVRNLIEKNQNKIIDEINGNMDKCKLANNNHFNTLITSFERDFDYFLNEIFDFLKYSTSFRINNNQINKDFQIDLLQNNALSTVELEENNLNDYSLLENVCDVVSCVNTRYERINVKNF